MKKKKKKYFKFLIYTIIILIIIVISLTIFESKVLNTKTKEEKRIELRDECSLMLGNIIHQIKTGNNCEIMCKQECISIEKDFQRIEFSENQTSCNNCICYCE